MAVAERPQRLEQEHERFLLHVDDAQARGDPGVGGGARVHQHRDGQITAPGSGRHVEPVVRGRARPAVREGFHARGHIDVVALDLTPEQLPPRAQPVEPAAHATHPRGVAREHALDPRRLALGGQHRPHGGPRVTVRAAAVVPLRVLDTTRARADGDGVREGRGERLLAREDLPRGPGGADDPSLGQLRERIAQLRGIG